MPAYSFSLMEFVPKILDGSKPHTIRPRRARRTVPGDLLYLYYKQRTRECRAIGITVCEKVTPMTIFPKGMLANIAGRTLSISAMKKLARADGFDGMPEFFEFFERYDPHRVDGMELVQWNPKKVIRLWDMHEQGMTPQMFSTETWLSIWNRRFGGA